MAPSAVRVPIEHRGTKGILGEGAIVVPRLDELREGLLSEALELVGGERGLGEHVSHELHEGLEVPPDDLAVQGHVRVADLHGELGAEAVDGGLERLRVERLRPAPEHPSDEAKEPFLSDGIEVAPGLERDGERHER